MTTYKIHRIVLFVLSGVFLALTVFAGVLYNMFDKNVIFALFLPNYAAISIIYLFVAIFFKERTAKSAVTAGFFTMIGILTAMVIMAVALPMIGSVSEMRGLVLVLFVCFIFIGIYVVIGFIPSATYLLVLMIKLRKKKKAPETDVSASEQQ